MAALHFGLCPCPQKRQLFVDKVVDWSVCSRREGGVVPGFWVHPKGRAAAEPLVLFFCFCCLFLGWRDLPGRRRLCCCASIWFQIRQVRVVAGARGRSTSTEGKKGGRQENRMTQMQCHYYDINGNDCNHKIFIITKNNIVNKSWFRAGRQTQEVNGESNLFFCNRHAQAWSSPRQQDRRSLGTAESL